ncbi:LysR family transcriptional regulator [Alysiella sp.]|uniref:LysR family transcriptional regulator n=1 Tax=Alysiella sp. TaxID=1872483 RepID=UPI0026DB9695|nr:LysR family transcriptional regulator [Alysiella sp.]
MNISLRQLHAFTAVAEQGSFSAAAQKLHLTQSALSGLIKELETRLDIRLFDRTTRQLHLSNAGLALLPYAKRVLNETAILSDEARRLRNGNSGQVKTAISQQLAASAMPKLIAAFRQQFPDIGVQLVDCSVEQVIAQVHSGDADFGIGPERTTPEDIQAALLFTLPFYAVLPPQHPLANHQTVSWADLQNEKLITLNGSFTEKLLASLPENLAQIFQEHNYSVNFLSTALGLVKNGTGITFCLPYAADWVQNHGLVMRLLTEPQIERRFFIYHRQNRSLSATADTFRRFLTEQEQEIWASGMKSAM